MYPQQMLICTCIASRRLPLHFEHIGDAGGFNGHFPWLLLTLFSPSTKQIRGVGLFIIGDGTRESGFAHVRVLDEVVVPDLDGDGL